MDQATANAIRLFDVLERSDLDAAEEEARALLFRCDHQDAAIDFALLTLEQRKKCTALIALGAIAGTLVVQKEEKSCESM